MKRRPAKPGSVSLLSRRAVLLGGAVALAPSWAQAFGQEGAFHPRLLKTGEQKLDPLRRKGASHWSWEVVRRTSAPARLVIGSVAADSRKLLDEPFVVWTGEGNVPPLTGPELRGLGQYLQLGGIVFVDDAEPGAQGGSAGSGAFGTAARREIKRVLPEAPVVKLDAKHVLFKSYYLLDAPAGRIAGAPYVDAIFHGRDVQVIFSNHDLLGALAREDAGEWSLDVEGGMPQREQAVRFAVNIAMYSLCSDYKDDQVHAQELMRRRERREQ
jgi:hypothetical protein